MCTGMELSIDKHKNKPSLQSFKKELTRQSHIINRMKFNSTALVRNKDIDIFVY